MCRGGIPTWTLPVTLDTSRSVPGHTVTRLFTGVCVVMGPVTLVLLKVSAWVDVNGGL